MQGLGATVAFLAAILMLAHLCREEGMFAAAGQLMARRSGGRPTRLLGLAFVVASITTAVLSLDATVVLLTPVVFATASRLGARPKAHVYATSHLANWGIPGPVIALIVVAPTLAGFNASSPLHIEPFWVALGGVLVLAVKRTLMNHPGRNRTELRDLLGAANPWFLLFVLGLGVIVKAVVDNGLAAAIGHLVPTGSDPVSLLLPLGAPSGPVVVLAVLIGVNFGPNLTYVGSLATLLWRRIADHDHDVEIGEFTRLGLLTVPLSLIAWTAALWASALLMGV